MICSSLVFLFRFLFVSSKYRSRCIGYTISRKIDVDNMIKEKQSILLISNEVKLDDFYFGLMDDAIEKFNS